MISEYVEATALALIAVAFTLSALFCVDSAWRTALASIMVAVAARGTRALAEWLRRKGY